MNDDDDDIIYVCVWNCVNIIEYMSVIISEYDSQNASDDSICLYNHCAQHCRGLDFRFVSVELLGVLTIWYFPVTGSKHAKEMERQWA